MEGLGKRLQDARIAKGLTLDEAARLTKIRPSRLSEIEAEDFSNFASLAYAKGFLQIYGRFLSVDVSSYLEAFEASEAVTVDGYSYLQDNPAPKRTRPVVARPRENRGSLLPLIIGVVVLVVGFSLMKLMMNIQRIKPKEERRMVGVPVPAVPEPATTTPAATAVAAAPSATPATIAAPRALPAEEHSPATVAVATPSISRTAASPPIFTGASQPATATATVPPAASAAPTEPEVRRAEPVRPDELANAGTTATGAINRVEIRPLRKTYIKVVLDNDDANPVFERWISPADGARQFRGEHVSIRVLDRDAVEIRKNGKPITRADADVSIE
ncbi:MAG: helix-turn-helix domain-containing protein [Chthoniobacterales bacterium]